MIEGDFKNFEAAGIGIVILGIIFMSASVLFGILSNESTEMIIDEIMFPLLLLPFGAVFFTVFYSIDQKLGVYDDKKEEEALN